MDESIRKCVADYQSALSDFYGTTKIGDFVKLSKQERSAKATQGCMKYNSKLTMILRLEDPSSISEVTLHYVHMLWKMFMKELSLSPHAAVIEDIIEEKLEITWLILSCTASKIKAAYSKVLSEVQYRIYQHQSEHSLRHGMDCKFNYAHYERGSVVYECVCGCGCVYMQISSLVLTCHSIITLHTCLRGKVIIFFICHLSICFSVIGSKKKHQFSDYYHQYVPMKF